MLEPKLDVTTISHIGIKAVVTAKETSTVTHVLRAAERLNIVVGVVIDFKELHYSATAHCTTGDSIDFIV